MRRRLVGCVAILPLAACGERELTADKPNGDLPVSADLRAMGYSGSDPEADPALSGVVRHAAGRSSMGLTLYGDEPGGRLIAMGMEGGVAQTWVAPGHDRVEMGVVLPGRGAALLSTDQGVTLVREDSSVAWQTSLSCHHDLWPLPDGGFLVPVHTERAYRGRRVRFDAIARLDSEGLVVERVDLFDLRAALSTLHRASPLDQPVEVDPGVIYDYHHLNAVSVIPADSTWHPGAWLLCLRNVDLVLALDPSLGQVLWSYGPGDLDAPHHPTLTPEGTILIFDNGRRRGWSRVLEIDPHSGEQTWEYRADGFFSEVRGGAQRLPGGTTLITESERGRVFEVTREGEIVWEWWNPVLEDGARRRVYRATRLPE